MTSMEQMDVSLPFGLKRERDDFDFGDTDDDNISLEDINNLLAISIPSLSANKFSIPADANNEFLRLTTMVRTVYFSYLHKCLLANYILCYKEKNKDIPCDDLKKCANQLELLAVRSSLEATLYRENMLKLISDVKSYTLEKKAYKKLVIFLETPPTKVDVGSQTINSWAELERADNIQSVCITSNCEEVFSTAQTPLHTEEELDENEQYDISSQLTVYNSTASPTVNSTSLRVIGHKKCNSEFEDQEIDNKMILDEDTMKVEDNIFNVPVTDNSNTQVANQSNINNDDENSQDSLLQHMEDMFCDSDDSSDLMTLIEKHSGVTKANMDKEISALLPHNSNGSVNVTERSNSKKNNFTKANNVKAPDTNNTGKYSFSYYKEMKNREANKSLPVEIETAEGKQKRRMNSIWFVERVYQVSKLKAKMTELSLKNYRKHGRIKQKFIELFGESDEEDMMPDSPICIEEHLTACKERIAPWIVKHLMPFYKKRRIKDRQLFKVVAKHIADMLIIENTFPEQECVSKYIDAYFKNKKFIKTKQDVYL